MRRLGSSLRATRVAVGADAAGSAGEGEASADPVAVLPVAGIVSGGAATTSGAADTVGAGGAETSATFSSVLGATDSTGTGAGAGVGCGGAIAGSAGVGAEGAG